MENSNYDEILQVMLKDTNLKNFVNPKFAELLNENFGDFKLIGLTMSVGEEDSDENIVTLMHKNPVFIKENKIIIDTENGKTLEKMCEIFKKL